MEYSKSNTHIPVMFPQLRGSLAGMQYPAFAEIKLDGELNYIVFTGKDSFTINKYGTTRRCWPALNNIIADLRKFNVESAICLGELYWDQGKAGALYDLLSHKKDNECHLRLFDIIELDGKNIKNLPLIERRELMIENGLKSHIVPFQVVNNANEVEITSKAAISNGWEGMVIKSLDSKFMQGPCNWVKLKYKDQSDYAVIQVDPGKERIEVAVPHGSTRIVITPNSANVPLFVNVGVKAPNKYKKHINVGDMVTIEHQGVLPSGSLRHPVLIPKKGW